MAVITTIQLRRGTLAAWTSANPVLAAGEPGFESDTNKLKFGDGSTAYLSLAYFGGAGLSTTLADGFVFVGSAANIATGVAVSGDLTAVNTGAFTVAKIQTTVVSGTTGSGNVVFSTSPTLVTPALGAATGTSLALGGGTALATTNQTGTGNLVLATSPTLVTPALGTPSALVLTNATGLPVAGGGTGAATFTDAGVLIGNGTGAIQVTSAGTAGQVLTSNGAGVDPTFQAAGGGNDVSGIYRTILTVNGVSVPTLTADTFLFMDGGKFARCQVASGPVQDTTRPTVIYIASADYPNVSSLTAKLRFRVTLFVNDVAPTGNFTVGLYPLTRPASSGGADQLAFTIGTVVTGSNGATFTTPAADSSNVAISSDFAIPADGYYAIGIVTTASIAASSFVLMSATLQTNYS
jgi:hypothetical protein